MVNYGIAATFGFIYIYLFIYVLFQNFEKEGKTNAALISKHNYMV